MTSSVPGIVPFSLDLSEQLALPGAHAAAKPECWEGAPFIVPTDRGEPEEDGDLLVTVQDIGSHCSPAVCGTEFPSCFHLVDERARDAVVAHLNYVLWAMRST